MNKEYTYIDGKVIIRDENGNQKPVEYHDNLDDVLIQENIIEAIEDEISYLEKESEKYKKENKKGYKPIILPFAILMTTIGSPVIYYLMGHTNIYLNTINTIFGSMNEALFCSSMFSLSVLPLAGLMEFGMYRKHKNFLNKEKGINNVLNFLKRQKTEETKKLKTLQKKKTRINENKEFRVEKVDDVEKLKELKNMIISCYNDEQCIDDGVSKPKEQIEKKIPTLVRKRK